MVDIAAVLRTHAAQISTSESRLSDRRDIAHQRLSEAALPPRAGMLMRASANAVLKMAKANAADLSDLARLIRRHAAETEKTVRDINQAESRLRPRIESAHALSRRVTEVHTTVQLSELHPWMALRPSQMGLTPGLVAVYYYADRGTMIDPSEVHKARMIVAAVPQIPQQGIPEWLKIEAQFIVRGL